MTYANRQDHAEGRPRSTWEAEALDQVQGHWFVMAASSVSPLGPAAREAIRAKWEVLSLEYDKPYEVQTFTRAIPADVPLYDLITGKNREGLTQKSSAAPAVSTTTAEPAGDPIRAAAPRDWITSIGLSAGAVGLALLVAGWLLWRRRGSSGA